MRMIKCILATLAVSCAFTATAFADNINKDYDYTYSLGVTPTTVSAGDTISVSVYLSAKNNGTDVDTIGFSGENNSVSFGAGIKFNDDVVSITPSRDTVSTDTELYRVWMSTKVTTKDGEKDEVTFTDVGGYGMDFGEIAPDTKLITFTFTVKEGVQSVTYDGNNPLFELNPGTTELSDTTNTPAVGTVKKTMAVCPTITVKGTTPAGPTVTKGETISANNVTEYTFANSDEFKDTKVLMTETAKTGSTITKDTRFKVTYDGESRYFGSDIWDKLAQGAGSISVGTVKFGLIVDADADASLFAFDIVELQ